MACCRPNPRDVDVPGAPHAPHAVGGADTHRPLSRELATPPTLGGGDDLSPAACRAVAETLMDALRAHGGFRREGIFRIPPSSRVVADANRRFAAGDDPETVCRSLFDDDDDEADDERRYVDEDGVDAAASLLKKWVARAYPLRRETLVAAAARSKQAADGDASLAALKDLGVLPAEAWPLFEFLADVAAEADRNKMPARNLATVFAPQYADDGASMTGARTTHADDPAAYVKHSLAPVIDAFSTLILAVQASHFQPNVELRHSQVDAALDDDDPRLGRTHRGGGRGDVVAAGGHAPGVSQRPLKTARRPHAATRGVADPGDPLAHLAASGVVTTFEDDGDEGLDDDLGEDELMSPTLRKVASVDDDVAGSIPVCGACAF
mmetsp:Transcript_5975/g.25005  ORF Transcript_5975/g.25005 Transcript_5975/m.25005 type:complete len:380 (+) Transcript_5975:134-1273(+)